MKRKESFAAMDSHAKGENARDPQELIRLLVSRANAGDIEGMVILYEPDAVLDCGQGRIATGVDAIRKFYTERLATGIKFSISEQRPALICGDLALTSARLPNGAVTAEIARKQSDGSWRWAVDQPAISREKV
jgi:ketosteroid isomerase-like protein